MSIAPAAPTPAPASPDPAPGSVRPRVAVMHDGARRRYAVPRALHRAGMLERMYAGWFVTPGSLEERLAGLVGRVRPDFGKRLGGRRCDDLDPARVIRNRLLPLRVAMGRRRCKTVQEFFMWEAETIGRWIQREGFGAANALFGFILSTPPSLCHAARAAGLKTTGDQIIAPVAVQLHETREQARRFPGWAEEREVENLALMGDFERRTWEAMDQITCMSEYVREGLIAQGVPPERVTLIEYPFDAGAFPAADRSGRDPGGPVTVGFVGEVGLRKGAPYFFEVARRFDPRRVRFVMVGPVNLNADKLAAHKGNVEVVGAVPRPQVRDWMGKFDLYYFPTTCEGSAGSVMEAMASGMPVVTTRNSGTVARDGVEGFVLPTYDDVGRFTDCITRLVDDRDLRLRMGAAARRRAETFNLDWYSRELGGFYRKLLNP